MKVQIEKNTIKDRYMFYVGLINMYKERLTDGKFLNF